MCPFLASGPGNFAMRQAGVNPIGCEQTSGAYWCPQAVAEGGGSEPGFPSRYV